MNVFLRTSIHQFKAAIPGCAGPTVSSCKLSELATRSRLAALNSSFGNVITTTASKLSRIQIMQSGSARSTECFAPLTETERTERYTISGHSLSDISAYCMLARGSWQRVAAPLKNF